MTKLTIKEIVREVEQQIEPFRNDGYVVTELLFPLDYLTVLRQQSWLRYSSRDDGASGMSPFMGCTIYADPSISGVVVEDFQ